MGNGLRAAGKAIFGDEDSEVIKAGTLAVTRGTGVIGIGLVTVLIGLDKVADKPWGDLDASDKLHFVMAIGFIWAIVAAADAIARGLATSASLSRQQLVEITPPLPGTLEVTDKVFEDVIIRAIRLVPGDEETVQGFFVTKADGTTGWHAPNVVRITSAT